MTEVARARVVSGTAAARRAWHTTTIATRRAVARTQVSLPGLFVGALFLCISVTPSLLPRTWLVQGFISAFSTIVGYATGVTLAWAGRRLLPARLRPGRWLPSWWRPAITLATLVLLASFMYQGSRWQRELYLLMGVNAPRRGSFVGVMTVTLVVVVALIALGRGLRWLSRSISRFLRRWIPAVAAKATAGTLVVLLSVGLIDGIVLDGFLAVASSTSAQLNDTAGIANPPPTSYTRSGSPASFVSWESLGMQGREFVTGGPTVEELERFNGREAKEPIRAYVGLRSAPSIAEGADLAVRELERTGAFSRAVLCVITTTGTGWVDPYLAAALEYMFNGDTALVGTQYSYLPSWLSFLTERERVQQAGQALFERVYARWSQLPEDERPRLLVFGESLGSLGSESAFDSMDEVLAKTDGALWAGPTNDNPLWAEVVAHRDPGSSEVLPIYDDGKHVRFAAYPHDLTLPGAEWGQPRVVYLQNASDPVTWWSPSLVLRRPDWLEEPQGRDVLPAMRWFPFVTFFQVTADLVLAQDAPKGHGHEFNRTAVAGWAAVAQPPDWSEARTVELTALLDELSVEWE
ncbi:MAG TPA: alpha/beta-hydrolase family protein [Micromonosporaceae bacterium]|nr:alpha/beta-hydrolase family protein [Micromonosporaceae bacterium]